MRRRVQALPAPDPPSVTTPAEHADVPEPDCAVRASRNDHFPSRQPADRRHRVRRDAARGLPRDRAILAAGYIYMFRDLRRVTMQALSNRPDLPVRFLLMHIEPPQDIHAERSRERYGFSYESALETVRGQRVLFEPVTDEPGLDYVKIADEGEFVAALEQRGVFVPDRGDRARPARGWRDGWSRRTPAK